MELFAKTNNDWKPLTSFARSSILDVWQWSEQAPLLNIIMFADISILCIWWFRSYETEAL